MENKNNLRRALLAKRSSISATMRRQSDDSIRAQLLSWWMEHPVQTLGIYWPVRGEPDLRPAYSALSELGVQLALPVVVAQDAALEFSAWRPGDALIKDKFGVSTPLVCRDIKPDAVLVPCVGFTKQGFRLGYGGGFYDRTLASSPSPITIGIAYACTLTEFDPAPYDIALDTIITDEPSIQRA